MKYIYFLLLMIFIIAMLILNCEPNLYDKYSYYDDFEEGNFKNSEYWSYINSNGSPYYRPLFSDSDNPVIFEEGSGYNSDYSVKLNGSSLTPLNFERVQFSIELEVTGTEDSYLEFWYKVDANPADFLGIKSVFRMVDAEAEDPTESIIEISGEVDWTQFNHILTPGKHEIVWMFTLVASNNIDAAWIDDIGFGENVNILEVQQRPLVVREKLIPNPSDNDYTELIKIEDDNDGDSDSEDMVNVKTNGQNIEYLLYNDGKLDLQIDNIDISDVSGYFSILKPNNFPFILTPYERVKIVVNINSSSIETGVKGTLTMNTDSNAPLDVYTFDIEANIVNPPTAPSGFTVTSDRYVNLDWSDGPADTHHYEVWRAFDDGSGSSSDNSTYIQLYDHNLLDEPILIVESEFPDNKGLPSQLYWYKLRIVNNDGVVSNFSTEISGSNTLIENNLMLDPSPWQQGNLDYFSIGDVPTCEWWYIDGLTIGTEYYLYWKDDYDGGSQDGSLADIQLEVFKSNGYDKYDLLDWDFGYPNGNGIPGEGGDGESIIVEEAEIWIRVRPYSNQGFYTGPYEIYFGENSQ